MPCLPGMALRNRKTPKMKTLKAQGLNSAVNRAQKTERQFTSISICSL